MKEKNQDLINRIEKLEIELAQSLGEELPEFEMVMSDNEMKLSFLAGG